MDNCPKCDKEMSVEIACLVEKVCYDCSLVHSNRVEFNTTTVKGMENLISFLQAELTKMKEIPNE